MGNRMNDGLWLDMERSYWFWSVCCEGCAITTLPAYLSIYLPTYLPTTYLVWGPRRRKKCTLTIMKLRIQVASLACGRLRASGACHQPSRPSTPKPHPFLGVLRGTTSLFRTTNILGASAPSLLPSSVLHFPLCFDRQTGPPSSLFFSFLLRPATFYTPQRPKHGLSESNAALEVFPRAPLCCAVWCQW